VTGVQTCALPICHDHAQEQRCGIGSRCPVERAQTVMDLGFQIGSGLVLTFNTVLLGH